MTGRVTPTALLERLEAIGRSLSAWPGSLALLGLGSVGLERERLDRYSDLDFFVIVETGRKPSFIADLGWLSAAAPLAYAFLNTADGYKALFEDGIFCEFAIFEPDELAAISAAPGRVVWRRPGYDVPPLESPRTRTLPSADWLVGEALTNLYVGLGRYHRGERLSAARFVQGYAVDRVVDLARFHDAPSATAVPFDPFDPARRLEQRFPDLAQRLPSFVPGYERTPEAAAAVLDYLESRYEVNPAMAAAVRALLTTPGLQP